jgi:lipopolysaccharide transport system permease protein
MSGLKEFFVGPFLLLWRNRSVVRSTVLYDLRQRYGATALGLGWTVLYPILFLGLYSIVYDLILQIRIPGKSSFEYVLIIFSGLIPFLGFSEALGSGVNSIVDNRSLVKGSIFPLELIAVKAVLVSSVTMLVGLVLLMSILIWRGETQWSQLMIPVIIIIQYLFSTGIVWLLSVINVLFRDTNNLVSPLILFLMLVSPIGYTIDMIPQSLMPIMYVNPLYYLIFIYRLSINEGVVPWGFLCGFALISLAIFLLGFHVFRRLKGVFADHV